MTTRANKWERAAHIGTAASAVAALIASGTALVQVQSSQDAMERLNTELIPSLSEMIAETGLDSRIMALRPVFARHEWRSLSIEELWQTPEIQAMGLTQDAFLTLLARGLSGPFLRERCAAGDTCRFSWDIAYRLPPDA
ncbi:hypothetical protein EI983_15510 [Roseovarius faecimaris]|uniref:Uncharacterized protein n=1 Tax=Roseovarius faecimaris TaxID=2494550 RepID=A0A6I6ISB1_9RHOB|nr:hypothetical protein [Roseovarius faecimaris]QGX99595.1 hypothetical protein EI983_15510 [Roseovarius faecimaris]